MKIGRIGIVFMCERDKRLYKRARKCLEGNVVEYSGISLIVPSKFTYKGVWNWDSMFHALAVSRWDKELAFNQIRYFTDRQCDDGMYCDAFLFNGRVYDNISKPPVTAWVLYQIKERYGYCFDTEYFYNSLKKNVSFWESKRCKDGLFGYDSSCVDEWYKTQCKNESGWDNSVRWDDGAENMWAIDLNCYMALTYNVLSDFAAHLNLNDESVEFAEKYLLLGKKINEKLWCDNLGSYCDYNFVKGAFTGVLSPASFFPLFAGVAEKDKAEKMKENAIDACKFYPLFPTVSYNNKDYSSSDYWRGPTWLNVAYFALKGLKDYGYTDIYNDYKERLLDMCDKEKRGIFEYYDSRTGKGLGARQFGWSAAFILELLEN